MADTFTANNDSRNELALAHFSEYHTFAGSDIKAFILPQGDQLARREMEHRIEAISQALDDVEFQDAINKAGINGEFFESSSPRAKDPGPDRGLQHDILPLVNLQSITISTFRAKSQVRALGHVNAVGLARGSRTVAGTFILTEFDRDSFWKILTAPLGDINVGDEGLVHPDQMRPFDIILLFAHELGNLAIRHIHGIEIVTNGVVYSIQDYYSENTCSYIAHDVGPLIPLTPAFDENNFSNLDGTRVKLNNLITTLRGSTLEQEYEYLKKSRNPFR